MRFLRNLLIILLLVANVATFAQEKPEDPDLDRALEILRNLDKNSEHASERQKVDEWIEALSQEFGSEHLVLLKALSLSGQAFVEKREFDTARSFYERQFELSRKIAGPENYRTISARTWLAEVQKQLGELQKARELQEGTVEILTRVHGPKHSETLKAIVNLAGILRAQGDLVGAVQRLEQVVEDLNRIFGPEHPNTVEVKRMLSTALLALEQADP